MTKWSREPGKLSGGHCTGLSNDLNLYFFSFQIFKTVQFFSHFRSCAFSWIFANLEFIPINSIVFKVPPGQFQIYWGHLLSSQLPLCWPRRAKLNLIYFYRSLVWRCSKSIAPNEIYNLLYTFEYLSGIKVYPNPLICKSLFPSGLVTLWVSWRFATSCLVKKF